MLPPTPPATLAQPSPAPLPPTQESASEDIAVAQTSLPAAVPADAPARIEQTRNEFPAITNGAPSIHNEGDPTASATTDLSRPFSAVSAAQSVPLPDDGRSDRGESQGPRSRGGRSVTAELRGEKLTAEEAARRHGTGEPPDEASGQNTTSRPEDSTPDQTRPSTIEPTEQRRRPVANEQPRGEKRAAGETSRAGKRQRTEEPADEVSNQHPTPGTEDPNPDQARSSPMGTTEQVTSATRRKEQGKKTKTTRAKKAVQGTTKTATKSKPRKTGPRTAVRKTTTQRRRSARKGAREPTPEDAEDVVIAPSETKMADLCKDSRKGKKSNRERELAKLEREAAARKRSARPEEEAAGENEPQQANAGPSAPPQTVEKSAPKQPGRGQGRAVPKLRMVNGNMIIDDQSLQIDRHADAAENAEDVEEVEENELTRRITSASWMKRSRKEGWGEDLTDRFYQGLRMFGTDFLTISKMFPGRTRRQIKLKFAKEERVDSQRIKESLVGPKEPMDLAVLSRHTNVEYGDPAEFQRELDREAEEHAEEQRRLEEQAEEDFRQKRAKTTAGRKTRAPGQDDEEGNENPKGDGGGGGGEADAAKKGATSKPTKPTKSKRNLRSRLGGGEEEIIGTIEG